MNAGRPCALVVQKGEEMRVMIFDDHNDALDAGFNFKKAGWSWSMASYEHIPSGEQPSDLPFRDIAIKQKTLFSESEG